MKRFIIILGVIVALVGFITVGQASATCELEFFLNGTQVASTDLSGGQVASGSSETITSSGVIEGVGNEVVYNGAVGNYTVDVTTGVSSSGLPELDLSNISTTLGAKTTEALTIELSDTGFTNQIGSVFELGGTNQAGTISASAYYDSSDAQFAETTSIGSLSYGTGAFSGAVAGPTLPGSSYSLTEAVTLTPDTGGSAMSASFNADVTATPEPASLLLVVGGILLFGFVQRRRLGILA